MGDLFVVVEGFWVEQCSTPTKNEKRLCGAIAQCHFVFGKAAPSVIEFWGGAIDNLFIYFLIE